MQLFRAKLKNAADLPGFEQYKIQGSIDELAVIYRGGTEMQILKDRIRKDGVIKSGDLLRVDRFLNHQTQENQSEKQPGQQFHQKITRRNAQFALTAFPPKAKITQKRNILVKADVMPAFRTMRRRIKQRLPARHPPDADIQKTPD